jgi:hypothetical protein
LGEAALEVGDEVVCAARGRVPAVEQSVDDDIVRAVTVSEPRDLDGVAVHGMNAAGSNKADEMQSHARPRRATDCFDQRFVAEEGAVCDRGVDPRQILHDRPARPQVQVTYLAVAHLARGQTNRFARRIETSVRPLVQQRAPIRHVCVGDGVVSGAFA